MVYLSGLGLMYSSGERLESMRSKTIKLPLSDEERKLFRRCKIRLLQIPGVLGVELSQMTGIEVERAKTLVTLAGFQTIPDIGPVMAECLVLLGYSRLEDFQGRDPAGLLDDLETRLGYWVDPCVEDQLRLVVYHAEHPNSAKRWWDFTGERKAYREKVGYPATRPTLAWNDPHRRESKASQ
jgi:hypothetical protein